MFGVGIKTVFGFEFLIGVLLIKALFGTLKLFGDCELFGVS